jgi:hypothetical protein
MHGKDALLAFLLLVLAVKEGVKNRHGVIDEADRQGCGFEPRIPSG